jgi:hypothetical protein
MEKTATYPSFISLLGRVIGEKAAKLLMQPGAFGGKTIAVPKSEVGRGEQAFAAISEIIGADAAQRLSKHFGGERIYVPKGNKHQLIERNRRIVNAYDGGANLHTLVSEFGLSDRRIQTILNVPFMTTDSQRSIGRDDSQKRADIERRCALFQTGGQQIADKSASNPPHSGAAECRSIIQQQATKEQPK